MIRFDTVTKQYPDGTKAVDRLSMEMPTGEITVLVGSSGSGKTTTLRMINRMIEPTSGTIMIDDRDVTKLPAHELRRGIGYVIQQVGLFPHRKVIDNVTTVPSLLGWDKKKARQRGLELLELVGLPVAFANRYPGQLSGGQQQRVGVARALAADPPVLLMDEPFGAVDPIVRAQLQQEFMKLQRDLHKTIVFVTHDIDEAVLLGDRIAVLAASADIQQLATPAEMLARPANDFVADFLGHDRGLKLLSLVPATAVSVDALTDAERINGWRLVTDEQHHPVGWVNGHAGAPVPVTGIRPTDSARSLLDAAVSAPSGCAVRVDEGGEVVGVVRYETIGKLLADRLQAAPS
jgi:osmoprotectant transport system ATP-binding protein